MRSWWLLAWYVFGDFNIIRYPSERLGCSSFNPAMFKFSDFIAKHSLVDLPLEGGEFSWFHDSDRPFMSKIDKSVGVYRLGGSFLRCDPKNFS